MDKARFTAIKVLTDIDEKKSYSNIKINEYYKKYDLKSIDRGLATEIVYGTLRWKLKIDYIIKDNLRDKGKKIDPFILNILRTAVYQIMFLERIPTYAAVNQAVNISKSIKGASPSFVNGVLRNILRKLDKYREIPFNDKAEFLSINFSHPLWFVNMLLEDFNFDFVKELLIANNNPPPLIGRVNLLKTNRDELIDILRERGIDIEKGSIDVSIRLLNAGGIENIQEFKDGLFTIQDESSMLSAIVLNPKRDELVLDLCSAPGGKATHMAEIMENRGEIHAFDIYKHKLNLIEDNSKRLGIKIIKTKLFDASLLMDEYREKADKVLVDAPCSGLGIIRKKPEIRWNIEYDDVLRLRTLQYNILKNAASYVKLGGEILYSTCTITHEEDEEIIERFLEEFKNFNIVDISDNLPECFKSFVNKGKLKLYPNLSGTDGFFIAKMKRIW